MSTAHYSEVIGTILNRRTVTINDDQIVIEKPGRVDVIICRNKKKARKFDVQVGMPFGNIYTISSHQTIDDVRSEYARIVEKLSDGSARIQINRSYLDQLRDGKAKEEISHAFSIIFQ